MAQFRHPNVVLLYGIVSKEEPVSQQNLHVSIKRKSCIPTQLQITLVVQLVEKGDLRNYLMAIRPK